MDDKMIKDSDIKAAEGWLMSLTEQELDCVIYWLETRTTEGKTRHA